MGHLSKFLLLLFVFFLAVGSADAKNNKNKGKYHGQDKNGDGVITREEWRGNDKSFRNHDWNGDGVLSGNEVLPGGKRDDDDDDEEDSFERMDTNDDGKISRSEWTGTTSRFNQLDDNSDGYLSRTEFSDRNDEDDWAARFDRLDRNDDGYISRTEWNGTSLAFTRLDDNLDNRLSREEYLEGR
jgi:Ca2+-binding EF-hand superfamily protein